MSSDLMNRMICNFEGDEEGKIYESPLGEKLIPYIGWFWRKVDFDWPNCTLGILPSLSGPYEENLTDKVGFMQNNKWGYKEFEVNGDQWKYLVEHIKTALQSKKADDFKIVYDYMQRLKP